MKKGRLIVFEGIDGSGKSTQLNLLFNYLKEKKIPVEAISFPRYDRLFGKIIKWVLIKDFGKRVSPYLIAGLFAGDRLLARKTINHWLGQGKIVLVDRYTGSSLAHQGAKLSGSQQQHLINWIERLESEIFRLPRPDKVIFMDVPVEITEKLMAARKKDLAEADLNYQGRSLSLFRQLCQRLQHWVRINCLDETGRLLTIKTIHQKILKILTLDK